MATRNVTTYTDELEHTWAYTYGPVGNVETVTSPLDTGDPNHPQGWTLDWAAVGTPGVTNFYQLTKVTDPAGKWVAYAYADPNVAGQPADRTRVVKVTEMADGQGNGEAETLLEYYHDGEATPAAWGHLKTVTDANGVVTRFGYDKWGYQSWFVEGEFSCGGAGGTVGQSFGTMDAPPCATAL